ncbi:MAG TPA: outer membrane beta-barrel protein [Kofleriaceae bacterium]|nr:outer membrane beta-barrel protein [Kofleriaceae bacterium]
MRIRIIATTLALACLPARNARAEEPEATTGFGMLITAGGGVEDFVDPALRDSTGVSGTWNARYAIGTRLPVTLELGYAGSAQTIDAIGMSSGALLLGNSLETGLRLNATTDATVQPYLYAGVAWRHYTLGNVDVNTSDVADEDDVVEIPFGVGAAYRISGVVADFRVGVRLASEQDMVPSSEGDFQAMNRWGAAAALGYEF